MLKKVIFSEQYFSGGGARKAGHPRVEVPRLYEKESLARRVQVLASELVRHCSDADELSECQRLFNCVVLI